MRGRLKPFLVGAGIAAIVVGCVYCGLVYASLRSEFRSLGLR
jgi:hypothetical protein